MSTSSFTSLEHLVLIAGNLGTPGAPALTVALIYDRDTGALVGTARIGQGLNSACALTDIKSVTGTAHFLGLHDGNRIFTLEGQYTQHAQPPAIGSVQGKFSAVFHTDSQWKGHCSFSFGNHTIDNVPVRQRG